MLEHQCSNQKGEEISSTTSSIPLSSPIRASNLIGNSLKYVSGAAIPQQPMFLASILSALQLVCNLFQYNILSDRFKSIRIFFKQSNQSIIYFINLYIMFLIYKYCINYELID